MDINLTINGIVHEVEISPGDNLLNALRSIGFVGVKHGCETGECGACTILLDSQPINACIYLAAQAEGRVIETIESLGEHPEQGWKTTPGLHILQEEFVDSGAIQCGYCTPAMLLAAKDLLDRNDTPNEDDVREAFSGILCRCTGYVKIVEAIEYACDIEAVITGKPSIDFFNQVLASIQLKPEQVALIGDDIYSDIQGAINAGLESRLVRTGKYRDGDENKTTPKANIEDNVLSAIEDLL